MDFTEALYRWTELEPERVQINLNNGTGVRLVMNSRIRRACGKSCGRSPATSSINASARIESPT